MSHSTPKKVAGALSARGTSSSSRDVDRIEAADSSKRRSGTLRKAIPVIPSANAKSEKWKIDKKVFIIPQGLDMSIARANLLSSNLAALGAEVTKSAKDADIIVADPSLPSDFIQKNHFKRNTMQNACIVTTSWATSVINGRWTDPFDEENPYRWIDFSSARILLYDPNALSAAANLSATLALPSREGDKSHGEDEAKPVHNGPCNEKLISELSRMADLSDAKGDEWRAKSYGQAAAIVKSLDYELQSSDQVKDRKGIGKRMAMHIDEIISFGKYAKLDELEKDPRNNAVVQFNKTFGVGEYWAARLYDEFGYKDVKSLQEGLGKDTRLDILNAQQRSGLKYFDHMQIKMTRQEVEAIRDYVQETVFEVYPQHVANHVIVEPCGSYRRGAHMCGDADLLFFCSAYPDKRLAMMPLAEQLLQKGFIKEILGQSHNSSFQRDGRNPYSGKQNSYNDTSHLVSPLQDKMLESEITMAICMLPEGHPLHNGIYRRLDLISYPHRSFAFGVMQWTGSTLFLRNLHQFAKDKRNLYLNDVGLYPYVGDDFSESVYYAIPCKTERDIFDALQIEYKEPYERTFDEIVEKDNASTNTYSDTAAAAVKKHKTLDDDEAAMPG